MTFSEEQIQNIEKLASVFLPISDIAVIIGVEPDALKSEIRRSASAAGIAYRRGKSVSKASLLANEMKLAKLGSPLGLESSHRSLTQMELDE